MLTQKINTYLAVLLITIIGSGAALFIVNVAETDAANYIMPNPVSAPLYRG